MDGGQGQQDLDAMAVDMMQNPISKNCWDLNNKMNSLFLLYCWIHDQEILTDDAVWGLDDVQALYSNLSETEAAFTAKGNNCFLEWGWLSCQVGSHHWATFSAVLAFIMEFKG